MSADLEVTHGGGRQALGDLINADSSLAVPLVPFGTVHLHAQPVTLKTLKAFLAGHGIAPPCTHDPMLLETVVAQRRLLRVRE